MHRRSELQDHEKCDHDHCHCVPRAGTAVVVDRSVYCGPGCAQGKGCGHLHCRCGQLVN